MLIFFSTTYAFNVSVVNIYERNENIFYSVSLIVLSICYLEICITFTRKPF